MIRVRLACLLFALVGSLAHAAPIADSIADFSNVQGQNGWFYGFFNQGPNNSLAYSPGGFQNFTTFGVVGAGVWGASNAQVGAQNNVYLSLDANGGHPNGIGPDAQDSIIWAVRRYTSSSAGLFDLGYLLRKRNISNPNGGGITGHIFVDGVELLDQFIANLDGVGVQDILTVSLNAGSFIDLAIDPTGLATQRDASIHAARADGTDFSATLSVHTTALPEPGTLALVLAALAGLSLTGLSARRRV